MKAVCGLDVHKDSIFLCILHSDGELFEQVFGVLTFQLEEMRKLLQKHHVFEVCMESTSIYIGYQYGVCFLLILLCVW